MIGFVILRALAGMLVVGAPADVQAPPAVSAPAPAQVSDGIDFGDDAAVWSNDGECDDKRFRGAGMTSTVLLDEDIGHDASDCLGAWQAGELTLYAPVTEELVIDGISFGDDSGAWTNDNQCDDPRFTGEGMSAILGDSDLHADATDCAAAYQAGTVTLKAADAPPKAEDGAPSISNRPGDRDGR